MSDLSARWLCVLFFGLVYLCHTGRLAGGECRFPAGWWGNWYQHALGSITISENHMTSKGHCFDHHAHYFLLENRQENCRTCIWVNHIRHHNILQYKESFCLHGTLHSLCTNFADSVLYTLVRENSQPVPCPFWNAFHVIYNNNSGGFCRHPTSYVHQCASDSRFHFRFRRCAGNADTYDKDVELTCLAQWKDGSELFFYGSFLTQGDSFLSEDNYRCFKYSVQGSVIFMSMSADPSCQGLQSPKSGPLTMELTQDQYDHWPVSHCHFPTWLSATTWRDLAGTHLYSTVRDRENPTLEFDEAASQHHRSSVLNHYRRFHSASDHLLSSYRCLNMKHQEGHTLIVLTHNLDRCQPRYQCVLLKQRHVHVVQIIKGSYVRDSKYQCSMADFTISLASQLLVSVELRNSSCPWTGRYISPIDDKGCRLELIAGCRDKSRLDIVSTCQTRPVLQLTCIHTWTEGQDLYFLAQDYNIHESNRLLCYNVRQVGTMLEVSQDKSCSSLEIQNYTSGQHEIYSFHKTLGECPKQSAHKETVETAEQLPENVYSHVIDPTNFNQLSSIQTSSAVASFSEHVINNIVCFGLTIVVCLNTNLVSLIYR